MSIPKIPDENSTPDETRRWVDRIARCATSCARTIEARKLRPNEVPLVIGALVIGLADHTELPVETILEMVRKASFQVTKEMPEQAPTLSPS